MVIVEDTLVVLRGCNGQRARSVAQREERHFRADQALLDHEARAGGAELTIVHRGANGLVRLSAIRRDDDAFSGRQTVSFQHYRETERP